MRPVAAHRQTAWQEFSVATDPSKRVQLAADDSTDTPPPTTADPIEPGPARWEGVLGFEGQLTGDGRLIEHNALRWENLPVPLGFVQQDVGGHDGAFSVGRILTIERRPGGVIWGTGDFDLGSEAGVEAQRQVAEELSNGVSLDLDAVDFEIRVAGEVLDEMDQAMDQLLAEEPSEQPERVVDDEGRVTVATMKADDEVMVTLAGRIRGATLVRIPAFADARLTALPIDERNDPAPSAAPPALTLVAGGAVVAPPEAPPRDWFRDPGLVEDTALVVTDEGQVYGHIALWGTCHVGFPNECVNPPESESGYAYFRTGSLVTAEGDEIAVGRITMDTMHAGKYASATSTLAHYEDTGLAVADVIAGEDEHGIWVAGAVRPGLTAKQLRALRSSPISGDWRRIGSGLEMVAALAVNSGGFPVPRPQGLVASGHVVSLVASGMVAPRKVLPPGHPDALSSDDLKYLRRLAKRERQQQAEQLASRAFAIRAEQLARRVGK